MTRRVAIVASHVIQYQDPFFRLLAADPDIDLAPASDEGEVADRQPGLRRDQLEVDVVLDLYARAEVDAARVADVQPRSDRCLRPHARASQAQHCCPNPSGDHPDHAPLRATMQS